MSVKPASEEEIADWLKHEKLWRLQDPGAADKIFALIARIRQEQERAETAEAERDEYVADAELQRDQEKFRADSLEAAIAARDEIIEAQDKALHYAHFQHHQEVIRYSECGADVCREARMKRSALADAKKILDAAPESG